MDDPKRIRAPKNNKRWRGGEEKEKRKAPYVCMCVCVCVCEMKEKDIGRRKRGAKRGLGGGSRP